MLAIIVLSVAVSAIAVPSLVLLMLFDVLFNSPEDVETAEPNVSLGKVGQPIGRVGELGKLVA